MTIKRLVLLLSFLTGWAVPVTAGEVLVAAAADLNYAINAMKDSFEKQTGHRVRLSLGSSGNFYSQIVNGAPYDIFLSADLAYPKKLDAAGLGEPGTLFVYAVGRIVLWAPNHMKIDFSSRGMEALADSSIRKIAIANPAHAPYGRAAVAAMEYFKVYARVRERLVTGENVMQAAQFVQSGAADMGIIPLSLALAPPMLESGKYWTIPVVSYPRLEQGGLILARARKNGDLPAALAFREWFRSRQGRAVLDRYGFLLPKEGRR